MTPEQELIERYKQIISKGEYPVMYYKSIDEWVAEIKTKISELEFIIKKKIQSL